jgi:hypothetical protein
MKLIRLVLLFASAAPVWAGLSSAVIVLPVENVRAAPAVTLVQPADNLCAILILRTTAKDADRQSAAMRDSLQRITVAIEKSPRFQLHQGPARFAGTSSSLFSSKAGAGPASLQTSLRVLCPLMGNPDVFEAMRQLRRFITTLVPTEDAELNVVSISLAVTDPEQYRARLLALIADQSRSIQQTFGARSIIIDGLQNPVLVHQIDDANIELYVDYQMSANVDIR